MKPELLLSSLLLAGLRRSDLEVALIFVSAYIGSHPNKDLRQISTSTIRAYTGINKVMDVKESLDRLVSFGIVKVEPIDGETRSQKDRLIGSVYPLVYVVVDRKIYYFNDAIKEWTPNQGSTYFDLARLLNLPAGKTTIFEVVSKAPVYVDIKSLVKAEHAPTKPPSDKILPYTVFEAFSDLFMQHYGRAYDTKCKERDLRHCKILLDLIRSNGKYPDSIYKGFLQWVFSVKGKEPRYGVLNCGILPYLWRDYEIHEANRWLQAMGSYVS